MRMYIRWSKKRGHRLMTIILSNLTLNDLLKNLSLEDSLVNLQLNEFESAIEKKLKSVNIWQSYKQERGCLVHFFWSLSSVLAKRAKCVRQPRSCL